ncbi:MAG: hypothetical protein ABI165_11820 [Bryobacteraceae bacterium]
MGDAAIAADRSNRRIRGNLGPGFEQHSHFPGADQRTADISVFRCGVEGNHPIAMLAVGLETVADFLRPLTEKLRALRTFDFDFFIDHGLAQKIYRAVQSLTAC